MRKNPKTKTIVVKLPADISAKVVSAAKTRRTTKSEIVRQALEKHLDPHPWARFASVFGAVDGPGDLSTNSKYMEGYGAD